MYLRYTPYTCADTSMYRFMRGMAVMYWTPGGISNIRQRLRIPRAFIAGVIARHIAPFPLEGSETTRLAVNGSRPLVGALHRGEKAFKIYAHEYVLLHRSASDSSVYNIMNFHIFIIHELCPPVTSNCYRISGRNVFTINKYMNKSFLAPKRLST